MLCSRFRTALSARVDGEALPPDTTGAALDAHLASCERCRRWEESARRLREATLSADGDGAPCADRLLARLRAESRARAGGEREWDDTQAG